MIIVTSKVPSLLRMDLAPAKETPGRSPQSPYTVSQGPDVNARPWSEPLRLPLVPLACALRWHAL